MIDAVRRAQIDAERGMGTIRSRVGANFLPCIWTECDKPARREHMSVDVSDPTKNLFFFFCSGRHRLLWRNSPQHMGQLPAGSKGLLT